MLGKVARYAGTARSMCEFVGHELTKPAHFGGLLLYCKESQACKFRKSKHVIPHRVSESSLKSGLAATSIHAAK